MKRVLVTSSRTPAALELVRAFGRAGWEVFTADTFRYSVASYSRYVSQHFLIPRADQDAVGLRRRVEELSSKLGLDLVIPTGEETFFLAECEAPTFTVGLSLLRTLHSKIQFLEIAGRSGMSVPSTRWMEKLPDDVENWVFKREFCRFGSDTYVGRRPPDDRPWLMQERLRGRELSCYSVGVEGEMTAFCLYHPLHRLPGSSGLILRSERHLRAQEMVANFHRELEYTGQLSFDFIETDDGLYAVDCNPRATSGIHFYDGDSQLADCFVAGGEVFLGKEGLRSFGPALPMIIGEGNLGALFRDWWASSEAGWCGGDVMPYVGLALQTLEAVVRGWREGVGFQVASTSDMEWDGAEDQG